MCEEELIPQPAKGELLYNHTKKLNVIRLHVRVSNIGTKTNFIQKSSGLFLMPDVT